MRCLQLSDLAVELNGKIQAVDINPIGFERGFARIDVLDAKFISEMHGGRL